MPYYNRREKGILQAALAGLQAGADPSFIMSLVSPTISGAAERRDFQNQYALGLQDQLFSLAASGATPNIAQGFLEGQQEQYGFLDRPRYEESLTTVLDALYEPGQQLSDLYTQPRLFEASLQPSQAGASVLDDPSVLQGIRTAAAGAINQFREAGEVPTFQNVFWGTQLEPGLARELTINLGAGTPEFEIVKETLKAEWERLGGASPAEEVGAPAESTPRSLPLRGVPATFTATREQQPSNLDLGGIPGSYRFYADVNRQSLIEEALRRLTEAR